MPIPAVLPVFVERVLAKAVTDPTVDRLRPIHAILSGVNCRELCALSQKLVAQLQGQLRRILQLQSGLDQEAHSAKMICLAVLARMASVEVALSDKGRDPFIAAECNANHFEAARKFFGPKKALKTMDMTVTTARWACSQSRSQKNVATIDEAIEILGYCKEIVQAIDATEKRTWLANKATKSKIPTDVILRSEMDCRVRRAVSHVLLRIDDVSKFTVGNGVHGRFIQSVELSWRVGRSPHVSLPEPCISQSISGLFGEMHCKPFLITQYAETNLMLRNRWMSSSWLLHSSIWCNWSHKIRT